MGRSPIRLLSGVAAAGRGIALEPALQAYLHAIAANLISAGWAAFRADIAGMRHEKQYTRLFRS